ncbi:hypothetical protein TNCV_222861 [Trichonephila clavipes]|nr:hypothetical protein TNCV_222861 [Trichonephila clavipes]
MPNDREKASSPRLTPVLPTCSPKLFFSSDVRCTFTFRNALVYGALFQGKVRKQNHFVCSTTAQVVSEKQSWWFSGTWLQQGGPNHITHFLSGHLRSLTYTDGTKSAVA